MHPTLAIDCGGGGIKGSVLGADGLPAAEPVRATTPYPLPPTRLLGIIRRLAASLPPAERVTVGMPGMIRHGVVVSTPHYVCRSGPRTRVIPELVERWSGFAMKAAVERALRLPALVLNDAEVHGYGLITGQGLEVVFTLGTGLGNAVFDDGALAPHMELSAAPAKWGLTYDDYLGEHERIRLGDSHWSRRVRGALEALEPVFHWDRCYVGGGNAKRLVPATTERLSERVVVAQNAAGITGGIRAWGDWA